MTAEIAILGTPYSYDEVQVPIQDALCKRVAELRTVGKLNKDALQKIRRFFKIKNIYHSNAIEGNTLNVGETRQVVELGLTLTGKPLKDQAEAKNLSDALDFLEDLASNTSVPITASDIRQIHHMVLKGIDDANAGKYRTVSVEIGGSQFKPPPPESLPAQMQAFGEWLGQVTGKSYAYGEREALLNAAVAHTWFVYVHPFIDGNGRVARLLMNLMLMRAGFPIAVITREDRLRYYDALEESQSSDLSPFIALVVESVEESLEEYEVAAQEQREMEEWAKSLASRFTQREEVKARNRFEVWRNAMELLKSYFKQAAEVLDESAAVGQVYFKDFGALEFEKYLSLSHGGSAKRTWFFRIDFRSGNVAARYLFFFGSPSYEFPSGCDVTLHVAREEPPGSFNYDRLDAISAPNVPDFVEVGYLLVDEKFVGKSVAGRTRQDRIEALGKRFFDEVINKHFTG